MFRLYRKLLQCSPRHRFHLAQRKYIVVKLKEEPGNHLPAVLWKPLPLRLTVPAWATGRKGQQTHGR